MILYPPTGTLQPLVASGIRAAIGTNAAGLYVPWVTGDTLTTLLAGASTSGNNQIGIKGVSDSVAGVVGVSASGNGVVGTSTTGNGGEFSSISGVAVEGAINDAATSTTPAVLNLRHGSSGTPAAGFGTQIALQADSSAFINRDLAQITAKWIVATHAARTARLTLQATDFGASREGFRLDTDGTKALISFFGANAVAKQTGGALTAAATYGSNEQTMLQNAYTALRNYGLLT